MGITWFRNGIGCRRVSLALGLQVLAFLIVAGFQPLQASTWIGTEDDFLASSANWEPESPRPNTDLFFVRTASWKTVYFDFAAGAQHRFGDIVFQSGLNPWEGEESYLLTGDGTRGLHVRNIINQTGVVQRFDLDVLFANRGTVVTQGAVLFSGNIDTLTGNNQLTFGGIGEVILTGTASVDPDSEITLTDEVTLNLEGTAQFASLRVSGGTTVVDLAEFGSLVLESLYVAEGAFLEILNWNGEGQVRVAQEVNSDSLGNVRINGLSTVWDTNQLEPMTVVPEPSTSALGAGLLVAVAGYFRIRLGRDRVRN